VSYLLKVKPLHQGFTMLDLRHEHRN